MVAEITILTSSYAKICNKYCIYCRGELDEKDYAINEQYHTDCHNEMIKVLRCPECYSVYDDYFIVKLDSRINNLKDGERFFCFYCKHVFAYYI